MTRIVKFDEKDIEMTKRLSLLAYIIPPLAYYNKKKKTSKWLKFHARQGMNLFLLELIYILVGILLLDKITVIRKCTYSLYGISFYCGEETPLYLKLSVLFVGLIILDIAVVGIINVIKEKGKKLPLIGRFNLFK